VIKVIIFDLDGTLVQTEILKAKSYARAAKELSQGKIIENEVIEAFKEVVGLSRKEVAQYLMSRFNLEDEAQAKMADLSVMTPWQAFVQVRLQIYESMLKDPFTLKQYRCPYNLDLLKWARQNDFKTGLATMSHCPQANRVLLILQIKEDFDFIATRDDVENGKPDPQIYLLVAKELKVLPLETLVIEDSPTGVKAALDAGMGCIAVTTDFTRKSIHASRLLSERWIIDNPTELKTAAQMFIKAQST
jgi:beta-phosphoglucomutase-like phosphatase (HAD superfamily)